jgi:hypothetical protein
MKMLLKVSQDVKGLLQMAFSWTNQKTGQLCHLCDDVHASKFDAPSQDANQLLEVSCMTQI